MLIISMVAAVSDDGFISRGTGVPWNLPRDREHFRSQIMGRQLLLGRKTYEEMGGMFSKAMPPYVLSSNRHFSPSPGIRVRSAPVAIRLALRSDVQELIVCGGSAAYESMMRYCHRLVLTRVHTRLEEGVPFPALDLRKWELITSDDFPADAENPLAMTIQILARKKWLKA